MREKLLPILGLLLLWLLPASVYDSDASLGTLRTEAVEWSSATYLENAGHGDNISSSSQVIVLKNPTFQELKDFLLQDPTSRNEFILNKYECRHFATEVNNNAEAAGLRCAFVLFCFEQGQHSVVAFETTDRGLIYIEPQTDARIYPEIGGMYQGQKIKEVLIIW
jgi:hypothetical protein